MERNENGFSGYNFTRAGGRNKGCPGTGEMWQGDGSANGGTSSRMNGNGGMIGGAMENGDSMGGAEKGCSARQLAMVYSPYQCWRMLYSPDKALSRGTLFEELDKPLEECNNG